MKIRTITVTMLLIAALGTMLVMPATAATATRTLPVDCVNAGEDFTVTIEADNYGSLGAVIETLCDGWEYQSTTATDAVVDGNTVSFMLAGSGPTTFTYTVSAPGTGCCDISGIIRDEDTHDYAVTGATVVCVCSGPDEPTATRTLPVDCVNAGEDFTVTIEADNYGSLGAVIETLCDGWEYQSTTATDAVVDGNTVSFMLAGSGPTTFTYTVSAPGTGCCDISGIIRDEDTHDYAVTGATEVCVYSVEPTATRTLPVDCVNAGEDFTVTIEADNYGSVGAVIETLCDGWEYQSTTATDAIVDGNTVSFMLAGSGPKTFTYTVSAPGTGCCDISGIIRDEDTHDYAVTGATEVCVYSVEPTATRTLPVDRVNAGENFTVTIEADNYGSVGAVIEVICDGWIYQSTTADSVTLIDANTISFPLTGSGPKTFTYTVLAPTESDSCCIIGGILRDETGATHGVEGSCEVCTYVESNWWDEWMGPDSEEGSTVTTTELQAAIHHWLDDIPVRGHVMSTPEFQWIIAEWLSG
ncbi:MAG: hypothetical protein U9N36_01210 [Euryarchaeota archaeon]|nr:hypothetical protein [Euryarchaeota archaeon]